jgi:hypothetical protein
LPPQLAASLSEHFPEGFDFTDVRIRIGVPRWAAGRPIAVTFRNTIYFAPGRYDPSSCDGFELLAHELAHVEQFRRYGVIRFVLRYLGSYCANRVRGHDSHQAYCRIPFEIAASDLARRVGGPTFT